MPENNEKELVITRLFDAPLEKVWKAWTDVETFKKWWGPKGFTAPDVTLDVKVGGKYHASMLGPDDTKVWSGGVYKEVIPHQRLVVTDYFSNEKGDKLRPAKFGMNPDFPEESDVTVTFEDEDGKTRLTVTYAPQSAAAFEAMKQSGMEQGWNQSLDKLAESLK
jgi:uncharacterized protein YndB with AHSA1/START domain